MEASSFEMFGGGQSPATAADTWEGSVPSTWVLHLRLLVSAQAGRILPAPGPLLPTSALSHILFRSSSLVALECSLSPVGPSVLTPRAPPAQPGAWGGGG